MSSFGREPQNESSEDAKLGWRIGKYECGAGGRNMEGSPRNAHFVSSLGPSAAERATRGWIGARPGVLIL